MAIKKYSYDYDFLEASVSFEVDTEKFTPEMALQTLNFFSWEWDEEGDPIDEAVKKYAITAIREATINNHNTYGVTKDFEHLEGFAKVDGSYGIKLTSVEGYEFDDEKLERK